MLFTQRPQKRVRITQRPQKRVRIEQRPQSYLIYSVETHQTEKPHLRRTCTFVLHLSLLIIALNAGQYSF